jgi:hypothetical protein
MYGETLTVTFGSKKYLRVNDKPRTISVRKSVLMLRSNTVISQNIRTSCCIRKKKSKTEFKTQTPRMYILPELQSFEISFASSFLSSSSTVTDKKNYIKCDNLNKV